MVLMKSIRNVFLLGGCSTAVVLVVLWISNVIYNYMSYLIYPTWALLAPFPSRARKTVRHNDYSSGDYFSGSSRNTSPSDKIVPQLPAMQDAVS